MSLSPDLSADIEAVIQDCLKFGDAAIVPADPALFDPHQHVPFSGFNLQELRQGLEEYFHLEGAFDQPLIDGQRIGHAKADSSVILLATDLEDQFYLILTE